ncbi:MAG: OmpH family outer membrane protein [Tannerella sp.]|jgi:outer membrane protein|nr:OmpH family outer membrane protein [Tannerella sp.]
MKKSILLLLLFIPLGILAQGQKIAVVNVNAVFEAMPEIDAYETEMSKLTERYESEYKMLQDQYTRKLSDFTAQRDSLTENIRTLRQQEIEDLATKTQNFVSMAQETISNKRQELIAPIQERFQKAIKDVGAENGYAYIFPNDPQFILSANSSAINITDKVKAKLGIK